MGKTPPARLFIVWALVSLLGALAVNRLTAGQYVLGAFYVGMASVLGGIWLYVILRNFFREDK